MTDLWIDGGATYDTGAFASRAPAGTPFIPNQPDVDYTPQPTPPPAPEPTAPPPPSAETVSFYTSMASWLGGLGLGELAQVAPDGAPSGWLWDQILAGIDTAAEVQIAIEQTAAWQREFNVIVEQRRQAAAGQPVQVMSVDEVVAYRQAAAQLARRAGLPSTFYDNSHDWDAQMLRGRSIAELDEIFGEVWERTRNVNPLVRGAFERFYGVGQGDAALAAYFLDPERTQATLQRQSRAAYTAGMGRTLNLDLSRQAAERIAELPRTESGIMEGLGEIAGMAGVFEESIGESGEDLTAEREGVASVFENDAMATRSIQRRIMARRATQGNAGGAAISERGVLGLARDR